MIVSLEKRKRGTLHFFTARLGRIFCLEEQKDFSTNKIKQDKCDPSAQSLLFSFLEHTYSSVHEQKPTTG